MLKPCCERTHKGRLQIEVGGLQARQSFEELFRWLLDSWNGLWCPAELVLACGADLIPVDGGDPVLRLGGIRPDAGDNRIRNFPRELGVPSLGKKHDLSDCEPMGLHGACMVRSFLVGLVQAAMHEQGSTCAAGERLWPGVQKRVFLGC
ncbi:hypothetical protein AA309_29030 [Microvirga vignae]|uniref:Uncharacterized protein n=1 Tax=Microvirga vignae TaxID=1225564 RepID=A0A0H1RBB3_9HYPH|nr:hypothetical protein AA309_29030 [Microvirga vignae]